MTTVTIKAVNVPKMTWVTWYKHRVSMLGIPSLFLLAAALLLIDGAVQRHWVSSHHLDYCLAYAANSTSSRCLQENSSTSHSLFGFFVNYRRTEGTALAVIALTAMTGLFAGVPWVAREFEGGGFRFTWTQGVGPRRWLLGTFGPLTVVAVATAAICGVAAQWWFRVAQFRLDGGTTPWGWESVEMTPLSLASWTLLAMALALLLGVTIRRVLPAMLVFVVAFGGFLLFAQTWLREFLFRVGAIDLRLNFVNPVYPNGGNFIAQTWLGRPGGPKLNPSSVYAQDFGSTSLNSWLAQHHLSLWVSYQPPSHLVWLMLARNGILIAVAAFAVLAAVWWLRRHPAE